MSIETEENWITNAMAVSGREDTGDGFGFDLNPIHAVKNIGRTIAKTSGKIGKTLSGIPVVGKPMAALYQVGGGPATFGLGAGAIEFAAKVASGDRVDKAALGEMKESLRAYNDLGPIIAMIPGVGPALTGAISTADAITRGKPVTDAAMSLARSQLPGGPQAQAAFDVSTSVFLNKPIPTSAFSVLPLSQDQQSELLKGVNVAKEIADGKEVSEDAYNKARALLPEMAARGLDAGVAVAQGKRLQDAHKSIAPKTSPMLLLMGRKEVEKNPTYKSGLQSLFGKPDEEKGYSIGMGASTFKTNPFAFNALRGSLAPEMKKGFDLAFATKIGHLSAPPILGATPNEKFGYYAAQGIKGAKLKNKVSLLNAVASNPEARKGALEAARRAKLEKPEGFVEWIKRVLGFKK